MKLVYFYNLALTGLFIAPALSSTLPENVELKAAIKAQTVKLTYYWVADENSYPLGSEVAIKNCNGGVLARVSRKYWDQVHMEGSGRLRDGTYINCGNDDCSCFTKSKPVGSNGDELQIYTSLAVNDHKIGSKVFINDFSNFKLPNGKKHNGCFKIIDKSWSFGGDHVDLYVQDEKNYEKIQETFDAEKVSVQFESNCNVLKATPSINGSTDTYLESLASKLTHYWIVDGAKSSLGEEVGVYNYNSGVISKVSQTYWDEIHIEGNNILRDRRTINCHDHS
ncbi:hypothetical protein K502DRAFT_363785 [Neoconidiobolus thromboides FSU 785]|nr:hypothetical protein K502DRAFT_363785 [Neoconidiobolus thromboides FSU 785]